MKTETESRVNILKYRLALFGSFLRAVFFYLGYWIATLIFGSFAIFSWWLPKRWRQKSILLWIDFISIWLRWCCGIKANLTGHIQPLTSPCVIVANHQSNWETFFLQRKFSPISVILKRELLNIPFFGWGLRVLEPIAIDRDNPVKALKKIKAQGLTYLQNGKHVLVFPEGTRRPVGELGEYKRSAADIAQRAGVDIIPIAHNSGEFWLNKKMIKDPGTIQMVIGAPITATGKNTKVLMNEIREWTDLQLKILSKK
ncbi:MAG: 1-acyl-sn-glycerol-3-phosphate acyltransferase [Cellvibrionaceae bacterium]|jgi:1-acyl-sn-glycerol-3-phosphate acyltransferase